MIAISGQTIGAFFDILLSVAFGVYACLIGWNKIKISKNPTADQEWKNKYGKLFRIIGPLMILVALGQLLLRNYK